MFGANIVRIWLTFWAFKWKFGTNVIFHILYVQISKGHIYERWVVYQIEEDPNTYFDVSVKKKLITDSLALNQHEGRFSKIFEIIYRRPTRILTQNIYLV